MMGSGMGRGGELGLSKERVFFRYSLVCLSETMLFVIISNESEKCFLSPFI